MMNLYKIRFSNEGRAKITRLNPFFRASWSLILLLGVMAATQAVADVGAASPGSSEQKQEVLLKGINQTFFAATGKISLSVDGGGSVTSSYTVQIQKPAASSTVRRAFLMAASAGFTGHVITNGEIQLAGSGVSWSSTAVSGISSSNHLADVTSIVKPIVDPRGAGRVSLTVNEAFSSLVDGVALAVVFDNPSQAGNRSISLLFGAQDPDGDSFSITLAQPINGQAPGALLNMGLGISFGAQASCAAGNQFSFIEVNCSRLTSSAGGEDDGACADGALITVGGLDDSNSNPSNPNAGHGGNPRADDELYSLLPFLSPTTTQITVDTENPSDDDNIFFAYFEISGQATVSTGGCVPDATTLCIDNIPGDRRFEVTLEYDSVLGGGISGSALATPLAPVGIPKGGAFSFTDPSNPEMLIKVLNGCSITNHFWVFYAAATTVGFDLRVEDTRTGIVRTYHNRDLVAAQTVTDTGAFATCNF